MEKTIRVTVGSTFKISPWGDLSSRYSGYTCSSTTYKTSDSNSFSINVSSTTKTRYPGYTSTGYEEGFYSSYKIEALEVGTFTINGIATCHKRSGNDHYVGDPIVTYHIVVSEAPKVTSISMLNSLELHIDEVYTISPVISETGATTALTWYSSNPSVVNINNGIVTGVHEGTSIVTCTASNGIFAQCSVTVKPNNVSHISLSKTETQIEINQTLQLDAYLLPENATNSNVNWNSMNESIAVINSMGLVVGISEGWTNITATTMDGSSLSASCLVHVIAPSIWARSLTLDTKALDLILGEKVTLAATLQPSNVSSDRLLWTSSDESIVNVDSTGTVTALTIGNATVIVSTTDGSEISDSCQITVKPKYENKCATPIIDYLEGRITLICETEDVEFVTNVITENTHEYREAEFEFISTYTITSYATKEEYENSDTVSVTICWIECEGGHDQDDETDIITFPSVPVFIQTGNGMITLTGLTEGSKVTVYDITGRKVASTTAMNGSATISTDLTARSTAIVQIGERSVKVIMR